MKIRKILRIFLENREEAESFLAFPWFCFLKNDIMKVEH